MNVVEAGASPAAAGGQRRLNAFRFLWITFSLVIHREPLSMRCALPPRPSRFIARGEHAIIKKNPDDFV
ncbi:hypothetical protein [Burkholderia sp. MSMB1078WGS]|uniref:hypothetical protein n=1 Tax=Burkholderia sp. MSMB1078WGS TaxID=1637900 RepID=UPI000A808DEA|nr:hypothetical protein [Burkholderia sp. MSMB1078WGS]